MGSTVQTHLYLAQRQQANADLCLLHIPKQGYAPCSVCTMGAPLIASTVLWTSLIKAQLQCSECVMCCYVGHKQENCCSRCRVDLVQNTHHVETDWIEYQGQWEEMYTSVKCTLQWFYTIFWRWACPLFSDQPIRNGPLALWVGKLYSRQLKVYAFKGLQVF